jgi:hypothetical protein
MIIPCYVPIDSICHDTIQFDSRSSCGTYTSYREMYDIGGLRTYAYYWDDTDPYHINLMVRTIMFILTTLITVRYAQYKSDRAMEYMGWKRIVNVSYRDNRVRSKHKSILNTFISVVSDIIYTMMRMSLLYLLMILTAESQFTNNMVLLSINIRLYAIMNAWITAHLFSLLYDQVQLASI